MDHQLVLDLVAGGVFTILKVAAPPLIMGLSIGILVSIFQAVTSIQEQTLAFVPKIAGVFLSLVIWGDWMLTQLESYMSEVFWALREIM